MVKKLIDALGTAIPIACALVVTSLVVRRELFPRVAEPAAPAVHRQVPEWRDYAVGQRIGPANARVTITEFSDYQCPFCRKMAARIAQLRQAHPHDVALVYRHFPLPYHPQALAAARASFCAGEQGRFAAYHDAVFARQDSLATVDWARLARAAGVPDASRFDACLHGAAARAAVERDVAAGGRLGVDGTPSLMVNGEFIGGAQPAALSEAVERALAGTDGR
ncbi:MAG TPA: thioredoxin domain-containing protein [Longimicrobiaceae bacterium]|nr:thioredoxin domain-containing protein [Longimicrobiaceae bacterium]